MRRSWSSITCLLLVACATEEPAIDDTGPADVDTDTEPPTALVEGRWSVSSGTYTDNGCSESNKPIVTVDGFDLSRPTEGELKITLLPQAEGVPGEFTCSLADPDFTCGALSVDQDLTDSFDAVLTYGWTISGSFSSFTEGTLKVQWDVDCEGSGCGDVEEQEDTLFPCSAEMDFPATAS